ncbi:alcohol dehydrogenase catalytic domain-containing protein [Oscillospiraceae bacterium PP1C4]
MNAAIFYGPEDIRVMETPTPTCPSGGALVKLYGSLICGTDAKIYKSGHPRITPPQIIGHESCGVIVEIDDATYGLKVGDRVTIQTSIPCGKCEMCQKGIFNLCETIEAISWNYAGTFAEYVAVPQKAMALGNLVKAPDNLTNEEVCLAEPLACVINGQELIHIVPGESVLVIGAGPIGILHAELARISGAGKVIIAEKSTNRLEVAKKFNYTNYIDTNKEDLLETVKRLTDGKGANVTIVTAPVKAVQEQAVETLAPRGRLSLFGSLPVGRSEITIDSRTIHYKEITIVGASSSTAFQIKKALDILSTKTMKTENIITHTLPLERIVEGINMSISGEALKVYLKNEEI